MIARIKHLAPAHDRLNVVDHSSAGVTAEACAGTVLGVPVTVLAHPAPREAGEPVAGVDRPRARVAPLMCGRAWILLRLLLCMDVTACARRARRAAGM